MLQADSALGLFALAVVIGMYVYFAVREVETPWETVRSGLVVALAHWVAEVVQRMEGPQYRAWKPDLLVPVTGASQLDGEFKLLSAIARGQGSVQVLAVVPPGKARSVAPRLSQAVHDFRRDELIASHVEIPSLDVVEAVRTSAAVLQTSMLRPNILFVNAAGRSEEELQQLDEVAVEERMGFVLLVPDGQAGLGRQRRVNVWIRFQESDWLTAVGKSNVDLLMLLGYQLEQNWNADLSLVTIAAPEDADRARQFLGKLKDEARLPGPVELCVARGSFPDALAAAPSADLNLFGLPDEIRKENLEQMATRLGATCLFVRDSGQESAFA